MGFVSAIIYVFTLVGADSSEFVKSRNATRAPPNSETKPLIDVSKTKTYGGNEFQRGNITVESDSE